MLWSHTETEETELYRVELSRTTRSACDEFARTFVRVLTQEGFKVSGGTHLDPEVSGRKGREHARYFCLPDTLDPRGPKR